MALKVKTPDLRGNLHEHEFYPSEEYQEIANYIQACAAILNSNHQFDGDVYSEFVVAKTDFPYSSEHNVNGRSMVLPAGFTRSYPGRDTMLVLIQAGFYEKGRNQDFIGALTHEMMHVMFPGKDEREVQEKAIKLLKLIGQNKEKFDENPQELVNVLEEVRGSTDMRPINHKAIKGGIEFLRFGIENLSYFNRQ